jgi:hypothetical protein
MSDSFYPFNPLLGQEMQGSESGIRILKAFGAHYSASPAAASSTSVHAAITLPTTGTTAVITGITNPAVPRCLRVVGNEADMDQSVVIAGTNMAGEAITETFVLNGVTPVDGTKAFKTVTQITAPTRKDADETITVGVCDKLGIAHCLLLNTVCRAILNGVLEAVAPTVAMDADEVEKNTVKLNSALDGNQVDFFYVVDNIAAAKV